MTTKQERRQDHFNKAYLGVIAQGEPATTPSGYGVVGMRCVYLTDNGSKCAVGHLLTEEELKKYGREGGGVYDLWLTMCSEGDADHDHPFYEDKDFYAGLQYTHDKLMDYPRPEFVSAFRKNMKNFAQHYNLEVPDEATNP